MQNRYMDEWSYSLGHGLVYRFLEPQSMHNAKDKWGQCQDYIEKWLKESHWEVYLGVYLNQQVKYIYGIHVKNVCVIHT